MLVLAVAAPVSAQLPDQSGAAKEGGFVGVTVMPAFTFDGETFEMFYEAVGQHPRACINYDASHFVKWCISISMSAAARSRSMDASLGTGQAYPTRRWVYASFNAGFRRLVGGCSTM